MPHTRRHIAEITDPTTGDQIHLEADTAATLEKLVEQTLAQAFPETPTRFPVRSPAVN